MKLTKNLTLEEAVKSQTATRRGINNTPTAEEINNLISIANEIFQPCRDFVEGPLAVTSGFRSVKLNTAIKGSKTSQHCQGRALDLDCDVFGNGTNADLFWFIYHELNYDQLICEFPRNGQPAWVHVSYINEAQNRHNTYTAYKKRGRTRYRQFYNSDLEV